MAAAKLWLLRILCSKLVSNVVKQLNVALLRVLLKGVDEGPRHGAGGLCCDGGIGPRRQLLASKRKLLRDGVKPSTKEKS